MIDASKPSRTPLTRDRIVAAAVALADAHGLDALSMRGLARQVGSEAMSLYNHVANKKDLLDGMVDRVLGEIVLPGAGPDWRAAMRGRALSAHRVLLAHPWSALLIVSRINAGPNALRYADATIGCLVGAGFSYPQADHAWNAIDSHIYGFTLQQLNFPFDPDGYAEAAATHMDLIPAATYPHLRHMAELVRDGRHDGLQQFEIGLGLLLDGLDRMRGAD